MTSGQGDGVAHFMASCDIVLNAGIVENRRDASGLVRHCLAAKSTQKYAGSVSTRNCWYNNNIATWIFWMP